MFGAIRTAEVHFLMGTEENGDLLGFATPRRMALVFVGAGAHGELSIQGPRLASLPPPVDGTGDPPRSFSSSEDHIAVLTSTLSYNSFIRVVTHSY